MYVIIVSILKWPALSHFLHILHFQGFPELSFLAFKIYFDLVPLCDFPLHSNPDAMLRITSVISCFFVILLYHFMIVVFYNTLYNPVCHAGMLSGPLVVPESQPSPVLPMPTQKLSHWWSPAPGTKCTTTCPSWVRPSRALLTHWKTSYRRRAERREELHTQGFFSFKDSDLQPMSTDQLGHDETIYRWYKSALPTMTWMMSYFHILFLQYFNIIFFKTT